MLLNVKDFLFINFVNKNEKFRIHYSNIVTKCKCEFKNGSNPVIMPCMVWYGMVWYGMVWYGCGKFI